MLGAMRRSLLYRGASRAAIVLATLSLSAATLVSTADASTTRGPLMLGQDLAPQPAPKNDVLPKRTSFASLPGIVTTRAEPALTATPRATCGPGSHPEPGMQGRIPPGPGSANGFTCNTTQLGHEGTAGGYKVERYVDKAGHECAYYDTTLLFATNAASATLDGKPTGTAVLDMSNPAKPVRTETLLTPAMQSPHESLLVNQKRGLLAAVLGNPAFGPGVVDLYDVSDDCRHPVLQSSLPVGVFGHESGFTLDGKTFYATSLGTGTTTAVDVTNPKLPVTLWVGQYNSHGMSLSDDGNRAYLATLNGLVILDTSEIQARKPNPQATVISTLRWSPMTIPQNAMPVTIGGKPYLVEVDEFSADASTPPGAFGVASNGTRVGGARIIDISNERAPQVISNIRLQVNQPENRAALAGDPGAQSPAQGYASHYCGVPQEVDPGIVACSFIASGLRVFDIRDPYHPKEIAYFDAPPANIGGQGLPAEKSDYAMSRPSFVPERGEIWYSDGNSGFYSLRVSKDVWPFASSCATRVGPPHGYVIRATLRRSRRGVSVHGRAFGLCAAVSKVTSRVTRVTISIARVTRGRCRFLTARGRFTALRSCRRPVRLKVRGTASWSFSRRAALPHGRYRVYVQATDASGRNEAQPKRQNARFFVH